MLDFIPEYNNKITSFQVLSKESKDILRDSRNEQIGPSGTLQTPKRPIVVRHYTTDTITMDKIKKWILEERLVIFNPDGRLLVHANLAEKMRALLALQSNTNNATPALVIENRGSQPQTSTPTSLNALNIQAVNADEYAQLEAILLLAIEALTAESKPDSKEAAHGHVTHEARNSDAVEPRATAHRGAKTMAPEHHQDKGRVDQSRKGTEEFVQEKAHEEALAARKARKNKKRKHIELKEEIATDYRQAEQKKAKNT